MLRALLRWSEPVAEPPPEPVPSTRALDPQLRPGPSTRAFHTRPQPGARTAAPKRRRKPVELKSLYPRTTQREPLRLTHARALLTFIREECPELIGEFVPQSDLEKTYTELCEMKRWQPFHWAGIGRHLADLTDRIICKAGGKARRGYRIPRSIRG